MINKLPVLLLLHTLNSELTSPVAFRGLTSGSQTLPSMRFPWTCLLGGLITTQTAGPPLRISWFSSSGMGRESLHHDQLQGDGNAAGPGTTLWEPPVYILVNMLDRDWLASALSELPWSTNMHSGSVSHGTLENDSTTWFQTEVQLFASLSVFWIQPSLIFWKMLPFSVLSKVNILSVVKDELQSKT